MLTHSQVQQQEQNLGFLIKTIIVGDASVGKSSILKRFTQNEFNPTYNATIGLEFESKDMKIQGKSPDDIQQITLQIWDTAGQESFRSIVKSFYRNSAAVLLVYDVTNKKSFDGLKDWIKEIRDNSHNDVIIILIGNKSDDGENSKEIKVSQKEVEQLFQDQGLSIHFYTSAKSNLHIQEYVATEVYERFIKDKHEFKNGIRSSSRSHSIDDNKVRQIQQQIDLKESQEPTPLHRYSIKKQNKSDSINLNQNLHEKLIDGQDNNNKQKKQCAC